MRSLMIERLVGRPWSPCQRTALRRRAVGVRRDYVLGDRAGSTRLEVVGLELVDVGGERRVARLMLACSCSSRPGSASRRSSTRARSAASSALKIRPSMPSLIASGSPPSSRDDERSPGREALGGGQRRAVPPHGRQHGDVDIAQQLADLGWVEPAAQRDHATAIQGAEALLELRRHLTDDPHVQRRGGQLRRLDQQLWPLVRVRRAEERDRQPLAGASGEAVTADAFPDCRLVRHRLARRRPRAFGSYPAPSSAARTASETARILVSPRVRAGP